MVDPVWVCQRPDGESLSLPKISQVRGRYGSAEATQDQVMVCVVPFVLDRHVL